MPDKVFFVLNPTTCYTRHQHETWDSAQQEAERLAAKNPGELFLVLATVSGARLPPVETIVFTQADNDIPF